MRIIGGELENKFVEAGRSGECPNVDSRRGANVDQGECQLNVASSFRKKYNHRLGNDTSAARFLPLPRIDILFNWLLDPLIVLLLNFE